MVQIIHIIHIIQIEAREASNLDYVDYKDSDFKFSKCGSYVDNMDGFVTIAIAAKFNPQCGFSL